MLKYQTEEEEDKTRGKRLYKDSLEQEVLNIFNFHTKSACTFFSTKKFITSSITRDKAKLGNTSQL